MENVIADVGATITGGNRRGSSGAVTLIGSDRLVRTTEDFDDPVALPVRFRRPGRP